jgi:hypothetical protein
MGTMTTQHRPGRDGKMYPVTSEQCGTLPRAERREAIDLAHRLVHGLGYTIRAAQAELLADHGLRRSLGTIHHDLIEFTCADCMEGLPEPGTHVTAPAGGAW